MGIYPESIAIEVGLRREREGERGTEQALLPGSWFRPLVMVVPFTEMRKTREEEKSQDHFGI